MAGFFVILMNTSCNELLNSNRTATLQGYAMGTTYTIRYVTNDKTSSLRDAVEAVFDQVNESLSNYLPTSYVSRFNKSAVGLEVRDSLFLEAFKLSEQAWKDSNGKFDPTVGALMNLWGFGDQKLEDEVREEELDSVLQRTGLQKLQFTSEGFLVKEEPGVLLDFNAVAKGMAVDQLARLLDSRGVKSYSIEVGGEVRTKGKEMVKIKNWIVAVDRPDKEPKQQVLMNKIHLENKSMASGGTYRKFIKDPDTGEYFVHVIDPLTGVPLRNNVLSVAVVAPSCAVADAYATAFMTMPLDSVKSLLKSKPDLEAFVISADKDGDLVEFRTRGFQELLVN